MGRMMALLAAFLLQQAPLPDPDVQCVDLVTFDIQNSELHRAIVADGAILNRTPWEMSSVAVEIVIIGDNKFPLGTMPRQVIGALPARKGAAFSMKGVTVPLATRFSHRITIRYTLEGQERSVVYENLQSKNTKVYVDPDAGPKAGMMGLLTIPGAYKSANKQQVYSGDTLFIRVRVDNIDEKALAGSQIEVTIASDGKKLPSVRRTVDAGAVKTDVSKLPGSDVDPKFACYDGRVKELLIGLQRVENAGKLGKLTVDAKFSHKGQVWTWAALEAPHLEALRPPDKK